MSQASHVTDELARLARDLGSPARSWAVLSEGNCAAADADDLMWVKASGTRMELAGRDDFVAVSRSTLLELVDDPASTFEDVDRVFDTVARSHGGRRPSVEALLHAVCLDQPRVSYVGHTHPVAVNAILCSQRPSLLTDGALFPDQVVVLGPDPVLLPYVDPGLDLGRAVRTLLREQAGDEAPRVLYLANHGMFALGSTSLDVLNVTTMAVKVAEVLIGASSVGGPAYLPDAEVRRIDRRPDEHYRRERLSLFPRAKETAP